MNTKPASMPVSTPQKPQSMPVAKRHPKHLEVMADRLKTDPAQLYQTLKATVFKGASDSEFVALLVVANEYDLNPILKQVYAFPQKGGGIAPIVSIDGWTKIINRQEQFDGMEFDMAWSDEAKSIPFSCTCSIYIKNRSKPLKITEYYSECFRVSEPWKNMPCRMLRHKALIQCARVAFGLSGIFDEDEARDIINVTSTSGAPPPTFLGPIVDEPIKEDDAPPGGEMPAKTAEEPQAKPEPPTAEQEQAEPKPAPTSPFVNFDVEAAKMLKGDALLEAVTTTLKRAGCTNAQLSAWAFRSTFVAEGKPWTEMKEAHMRNILTRFAAIGPAVKEIEV